MREKSLVPAGCGQKARLRVVRLIHETHPFGVGTPFRSRRNGARLAGMRPGRVAAQRAPNSWRRSRSFGKGHNGCVPRRTGHRRLLPHSTLRAPGRSRFRAGAPAAAFAVVQRGARGCSRTRRWRAPGRSRISAAPRALHVPWTRGREACPGLVAAKPLLREGAQRLRSTWNGALSAAPALDAAHTGSQPPSGRGAAAAKQTSHGARQPCPHSSCATGARRLYLLGQQRITRGLLR